MSTHIEASTKCLRLQSIPQASIHLPEHQDTQWDAQWRCLLAQFPSLCSYPKPALPPGGAFSISPLLTGAPNLDPEVIWCEPRTSHSHAVVQTLTFSPVTAEIRSLPNWIGRAQREESYGLVFHLNSTGLNKHSCALLCRERHSHDRAIKPHLLMKPHKSFVHGIEASPRGKDKKRAFSCRSLHLHMHVWRPPVLRGFM